MNNLPAILLLTLSMGACTLQSVTTRNDEAARVDGADETDPVVLRASLVSVHPETRFGAVISTGEGRGAVIAPSRNPAVFRPEMWLVLRGGSVMHLWTEGTGPQPSATLYAWDGHTVRVDESTRQATYTGPEGVTQMFTMQRAGIETRRAALSNEEADQAEQSIWKDVEQYFAEKVHPVVAPLSELNETLRKKLDEAEAGLKRLGDDAVTEAKRITEKVMPKKPAEPSTPPAQEEPTEPSTPSVSDQEASDAVSELEARSKSEPRRSDLLPEEVLEKDSENGTPEPANYDPENDAPPVEEEEEEEQQDDEDGSSSSSSSGSSSSGGSSSGSPGGGGSSGGSSSGGGRSSSGSPAD